MRRKPSLKGEGWAQVCETRSSVQRVPGAVARPAYARGLALALERALLLSLSKNVADNVVQLLLDSARSLVAAEAELGGAVDAAQAGLLRAHALRACDACAGEIFNRCVRLGRPLLLQGCRRPRQEGGCL